MPSTSSPFSRSRKPSTCSCSSSVSASASSANSPKPSTSPFHPDFLPLLNHLAGPLIQLVHCTSGAKPSDWPSNILKYHLLSTAQLDNLSRFFDQTWPPVPETHWYPRQLEPWLGTPNESEIDIDTRRRRFGYFIGLYNSDSPTGGESSVKKLGCSLKLLKCFEYPVLDEQDNGRKKCEVELEDPDSSRHEVDSESAEELRLVQDMLDWMECEWQLALVHAREEQSDRFAWNPK